jgi:hypothetical protein
VLLIVCRNTYSVVRNFNHNGAALCRYAYQNVATGRGVLHGIVQKILKQSVNGTCINLDLYRKSWQLERNNNLAIRGDRYYRINRRLQEIYQIRWLHSYGL